MKILDYREIIKIVATAGNKRETVEIYYPKTENTPKGWREVEPYSLTNDIGEEGEHLIYGKDRLSPGHILNAYTISSSDNHCDSFIISKIKSARSTGKRFKPRKNWEVEF